MKNSLIHAIVICTCLCFSGCSFFEVKEDYSKYKIKLTKEERTHRLSEEKPILMKPVYDLNELPDNLVGKINILTPSTIQLRADGSAWRPIGNFGPFINGPEFDEIKIFLQTQTTINWIWSNYFVNHPDASIYMKYFHNFPPYSATANILHNPGKIPAIGTTDQDQIGFDNVLFQLYSISWSSQYGGSICLEFNLIEDIQFEIRKGDILWDLSKCFLRVYVNPLKQSMNPISNGNLLISPLLMKRYTNVELIPRDEILQYSVTDPEGVSQRLEKATEINETQLRESLLIIAERIREKIAESAFRFAHGFLHSQFQDRLEVQDAVDSIEITDNYVDFITHKREPFMILQSRIVMPMSFTDIGYLDKGLVVNTKSSFIWRNGEKTHGLSYSEKFDSGYTTLYTRWHSHGSYKLNNNCDWLVAAKFEIRAIEEDSLSADDKFEPLADWWLIPTCAELTNQIPDLPQLPIVITDGYSVDHDLILDGSDEGSLRMEYRLLIAWQ